MKLLVISQDIGLNAPGQVFETLLSELSKMCDIELWAFDYFPSDALCLEDVHVIRHPSRFIKRLSRYSMACLGTDVIHKFYSRKVRPAADDYDAILSFVSAGHYFGLVAAGRLKERLNIPLITYFVDAVPAPEAWVNDRKFSENTGRFVRKYTGCIDMFASSNEKMLEYQRQFMNPDVPGTVVYTPCRSDKLTILKKRSEGEPFILLYAGNIYGARNPQYLLKAFREFVQGHSDAYLYFVGSFHHNMHRESWDDLLREHVVFKPFAKDLSEYYKQASVLVDMDADLPDDVYLSSKSMNYLGYDRPIICETGKDSVSRRIYAGIDSILQCDHSADEILSAIERCYAETFDFSDREGVINELNVKTVAGKFFNEMKTFLASKHEQ